MAQSFDICIRGAGVVGRTLALLLARERLNVALVANTAPAPEAADVRAYALNAASDGSPASSAAAERNSLLTAFMSSAYAT